MLLAKPASALALLVTVTACAAPPPAVDLAALEAAIRSRGVALVAAEQARDTPTAVSYFTEDAVIHMAMMPAVTGRAALPELYEGLYAMLGPDGSFTSTTTAVAVAASGDLAVEHGMNHFTVGGAMIMGKYLAMWRKIGGEWYVSHLAVSDDQPPAAPTGS